MPRKKEEQEGAAVTYSERELFCFLVLAVATGYGRLNRGSFHACAINTIFAIRAGGGCGVCDFLWAWERKEKEPGFCVCVCV